MVYPGLKRRKDYYPSVTCFIRARPFEDAPFFKSVRAESEDEMLGMSRETQRPCTGFGTGSLRIVKLCRSRSPQTSVLTTAGGRAAAAAHIARPGLLRLVAAVVTQRCGFVVSSRFPGRFWLDQRCS